MLNFTVGPVMSNERVRAIGGEQVPYFRTEEFSKIMLENEQLMLAFSEAPENSRCVFITGSGTASMEAVVMNTLSADDKAIVVNGGSFGQRFADICRVHDVPCSEIRLEPGRALTAEMLQPYEGGDYSAFLVNVHETSTGVYYDMELISDFCRRNGLYLIVDAISSFIADPFHMADWGVDVMITGSQKALACPPGISAIVLSPRALQRVEESRCRCYYLNLKEALKDGKRGQTPFTPAVGILLQIHERLTQIRGNGGIASETAKVAAVARDFREKIREFPFELVSESLSNAVTSLHPLNVSAYDVFLRLKDEYQIWVCPNGGALKDSIFRVGHIGNLSCEDNDRLIRALEDMRRRGLL